MIHFVIKQYTTHANLNVKLREEIILHLNALDEKIILNIVSELGLSFRITLTLVYYTK